MHVESSNSSGNADEPEQVVQVWRIAPFQHHLQDWGLKEVKQKTCISSVGENEMTFKSILQCFYHGRNQVFLATEIGLIIADFYLN